jgi:hypothetical protein
VRPWQVSGLWVDVCKRRLLRLPREGVPARFGRSACSADGVRGCPRDPPSGCQHPRTYGGQGRRGEGHSAAFTQVRGYIEVQAGAVCKTVGSAYVGSNPTPATHLRRSKPVTLDCVTGFSHERKRFSRPLAFGCGPCVGQIRTAAVAAQSRPGCLLSCGNGHGRTLLQRTAGRARPVRLWAIRRSSGVVHGHIADRVWPVPAVRITACCHAL